MRYGAILGTTNARAQVGTGRDATRATGTSQDVPQLVALAPIRHRKGRAEMKVKLDKFQRAMAERVLERIATVDGSLDEVVYALVAAERALAIQGSYRAPEQAYLQETLNEVRHAMAPHIHPNERNSE